MEPVWIMPQGAGPALKMKMWLDYQNDVKVSDVQLAAREGWTAMPAVQQQRLHEIKSCDILQPGPAALTDGVAQLHQIFSQWADRYA